MSHRHLHHLHNPDNTLRRSPRFMNQFQKLPDELTLAIFSRLKDPKTLLRCYAVSKPFSSVVSDIHSLVIHISYPHNVTPSKCSHLHYHIPHYAIPGLMKAFANLKHLQIKICLLGSISASSPASKRLDEHLHDGDMFMLKVVWGHEIQIRITEACEVGLLSNSLYMKSRKFHPWTLEMNSFFFHQLYPLCPRYLKRLVVSAAKVHDAMPKGKLFMEGEQLPNLAAVGSRSLEGWLKNPENVVYWFKNSSNERQLKEKVLLVNGQERLCKNGEMTILKQPDRKFVKESDVQEMLSTFEEDDDNEQQ